MNKRVFEELKETIKKDVYIDSFRALVYFLSGFCGINRMIDGLQLAELGDIVKDKPNYSVR